METEGRRNGPQRKSSGRSAAHLLQTRKKRSEEPGCLLLHSHYATRCCDPYIHTYITVPLDCLGLHLLRCRASPLSCPITTAPGLVRSSRHTWRRQWHQSSSGNSGWRTLSPRRRRRCPSVPLSHRSRGACLPLPQRRWCGWAGVSLLRGSQVLSCLCRGIRAAGGYPLPPWEEAGLRIQPGGNMILREEAAPPLGSLHRNCVAPSMEEGCPRGH